MSVPQEVKQSQYVNAMGDTHDLRHFADGSVVVNDFDAFSSEAVAKRYCDSETIYDDDGEGTQAQAFLRKVGAL